jgi:hypothetical protein
MNRSFLSAVTVLLVALLAPMSAYGGEQGKGVSKKQTHASALIEQAKRQVRQRLKDSHSAKFRNVSVCDDGVIVTGEVNAKNEFGGYVGYRGFISRGTGAFDTIINEPGEVALLCTKVAHDDD